MTPTEDELAEMAAALLVRFRALEAETRRLSPLERQYLVSAFYDLRDEIVELVGEDPADVWRRAFVVWAHD